jgi:hypothetical protein
MGDKWEYVCAHLLYVYPPLPYPGFRTRVWYATSAAAWFGPKLVTVRDQKWGRGGAGNLVGFPHHHQQPPDVHPAIHPPRPKANLPSSPRRRYTHSFQAFLFSILSRSSPRSARSFPQKRHGRILPILNLVLLPKSSLSDCARRCLPVPPPAN